ncbi:MAG: Ryanodine receptor Ryr [Alphaproteobacteria bacterium]|nr:Ryanodine receptor Ryr [Alphaproteobacteria bacterium]
MAIFKPQPIDTRSIILNPELTALTEKLAENAHDNWAMLRFKEGWTYGPKRDDASKQHPNLVAYDELSESDKDLDRGTAMQTIKAMLAMGYEIRKN